MKSYLWTYAAEEKKFHIPLEKPKEIKPGTRGVIWVRFEQDGECFGYECEVMPAEVLDVEEPRVTVDFLVYEPGADLRAVHDWHFVAAGELALHGPGPVMRPNLII